MIKKFIPCFLAFLCTVSDLCPYIKIKSMQITGSFATCKSPGLHPSQPCTFPRCPKSEGATALHGLCWQSQACPNTRPLTRTGTAPGREGADIPALPVKSVFQRLCLGVGKNKEGLPVHMQSSTLCCTKCQAQGRSTSPPVPPHCSNTRCAHCTSSVSSPSYLPTYTCPLKDRFLKTEYPVLWKRESIQNRQGYCLEERGLRSS